MCMHSVQAQMLGNEAILPLSFCELIVDHAILQKHPTYLYVYITYIVSYDDRHYPFYLLSLE